jgi:site-specific DNA-methyltransferase (adenine-specific)
MGKRSSHISKLGDIWLLDRHRLMCGDSTNIKQAKLLMSGEKADMAFTDPPYNVNYRGRKGIVRKKIKNDCLTKPEYLKFLHQFLLSQQQVLKRGASLYLFYPWVYHREFQNELETYDYEIRNQIIWAKNHFVLSFSRYKAKHELLLYCHRKDEVDPWYGDRKQHTLWEFPKPSVNKLHPTMKPIALIERALLNSSKKDDVVLDLFGGSGSTLMACEHLERSARLMEIESEYVDATIVRWQTATQRDAILISNGLTFNQLKKKTR